MTRGSVGHCGAAVFTVRALLRGGTAGGQPSWHWRGKGGQQGNALALLVAVTLA